MPEDSPVQLSFNMADVILDTTPGGEPVDPAAREAAKKAFYDALIARSATPPTCLPDHGVHVYAWANRVSGPCQCKTRGTGANIDGDHRGM